MNELDRAVLRTDVPDYGLEPGDVGTVVHCYAEGRAYEVEFITGGGRTVAVLTLKSGELRPLSSDEILHARRVPPRKQ